MAVYNDYNSNLTHMFCCVKDRTLSLLKELGFLPLNSREDFDVLLKFFSKDEFTDDYLKEELELSQVYLKPLEQESIQKPVSYTHLDVYKRQELCRSKT